MSTTTWTNTRPQRRFIWPTTWFNAVFKAYATRKALAKLDPAGLEDIGLSHRDAAAEANRPFWDVPNHWLR